jgi:hypothetical protein
VLRGAVEAFDLPRRDPPPERLDLDALVSPEDSYRQQLSHAMFYRPVLIKSLRAVRYGFHDPSLRGAAERAKRAMDGLDVRFQGSTFPSSRQIGASIHY